MGIFYDHTDSTYVISALGEEIRATVTDSGDVVADWIDDIRRIHHRRLDRLAVGLDIEWCPHGFHGTSGQNPVALLQLCVGRRCLVFQLIHCDYIPKELDDFLSDLYGFFGVGIKDDLEKLEFEYNLEVPYGYKLEELNGTYDLGKLAANKMGRKEMSQWGLKDLVREVMGVHMEKPRRVTLSNWAKRVLSMEQIEYAAVDAFASFEVGRRLYFGYF